MSGEPCGPLHRLPHSQYGDASDEQAGAATARACTGAPDKLERNR